MKKLEIVVLFLKTRTYKLQKTGLSLFMAVFLLLQFSCETGSREAGISVYTADHILEKINVPRGIIAIVGDTSGQLAIELAQRSELVIYSQLQSGSNLKASRSLAEKEGYLGTRIYLELSNSNRIHLADNIADAVVVINADENISEDEVLRVLRPEGKAFIGSNMISKLFPKGVDDWSHPYHLPDNNTQSDDKIITAPYLTQFLANPQYAPATQVTVASAGRVFKGFGNVAFHEREEAYLNKMVAFNGYNGTMLWQRELPAGIMLHRSTIIASPERLYFGDDKSCKIIDTRTGRLIDEIVPPLDIAGGTFWKWMGMENGTLFAVIGEQEQKDPVKRWKRKIHGWPWNGISEGFNKESHEWGYGKNILAINPETKKVNWSYHEDEPMDTRALSMKNGRIYLFRFDTYLTCLNAKSGKVIWRKTKESDPELFEAFGRYLPRQNYDTNWRTRNYMMCSDDALFFAGPQMDKLLVLSTKDGSVLWENAYNNFQLVLREDGLYGISGPWNQNVSKKFEPLTGELLAELPTGRRACTRPNATSDAILFRASGGSIKFNIESNEPQWISPMRPSCQDGVTIANGMLYWWPYVCDCQLSIYGVTGVGPAGEFDFYKTATNEERLQTAEQTPEGSELLISSSDWPTFRKDNKGLVSTTVTISEKSRGLWKFPERDIAQTGSDVLGHPHYIQTTAPVTADGIAYYADSKGIVRAINVTNGKLEWEAYTGGAVKIAPTLWKDKLYVGSGDGYVYCFKSRTGDLVWKFRAAPVERKIPVYGSLMSTWPVGAGVLIEDGILYAAAGIVNYDGTYVYALDAETGKIKWENNTSGHLLKEAKTGASVLGHMLINNDKLYIASGTSLSPAVYDLNSGICLNDSSQLEACQSFSPRGWELFLTGDHVIAAGKPFYSHPEHEVYDLTVTRKMLHTSMGNRDILWVHNKKILCYPKISKQALNESVTSQMIPGQSTMVWESLDPGNKPLWEFDCDNSVAVAVTKNVVIVAKEHELIAINITTGKQLWAEPLLYAPVPWGLCVSRDGKIIVTRKDGSVVCFGGESTMPTPYVSSKNTFFVDEADVTLSCKNGQANIHYTLDGTNPGPNSPMFTKPFKIREPLTLKMRAINKSQQSFVVTTHFVEVDYAMSSAPGEVATGIEFEYFEGSFLYVADLDKVKPVEKGVKDIINLTPRANVNAFGYKYSGYFVAPKEGVYTFYIESNDGSKLYLNGEELIDNDGAHGIIEKAGKMALKAGEYPLEIKYFQAGGGLALKVSWEGPGMEKREMTSAVLCHKK